MERVYLFHSPNNSRFCGGVFTKKEIAERWILINQLSGVLTEYPVDIGVFDWAVEKGVFNPKGEKQKSPEFKGGFSSAGQKHFHYEDGVLQ